MVKVVEVANEKVEILKYFLHYYEVVKPYN